MPLLACDASQLEWRCAAELSHDEVAMKEIINGKDTHSLNQQAFDLPSRLIAKIYLFRTIFKGSGWAFANDNDFSHVSSDPKYWDAVNDKFYKKYFGLNKQHERWADAVLSGQPIAGPLGREWSIDVKPKPGKEFKIPWTTLSNYPVQGTGADVMCIARVSAYRRIKASGIPCKFISTVHDSIVIDTPTGCLQQVADIFYQVFDDLQLNIKRMFKYEWLTPLTCECKFGMDMKNMSKIDRSA
jgi:DNA polymerase I